MRARQRQQKDVSTICSLTGMIDWTKTYIRWDITVASSNEARIIEEITLTLLITQYKFNLNFTQIKNIF